MSRARPTTRIRVGPNAASHRCTLRVSGQSAIHRYVPLTTRPTCGVPLIATAAATGRIRASTSRDVVTGCENADARAPVLSHLSVAPESRVADALYSLQPASNAMAMAPLRLVRVAIVRRTKADLTLKQRGKGDANESACVVVISAKPIASPRDTSTLRGVNTTSRNIG